MLKRRTETDISLFYTLEKFRGGAHLELHRRAINHDHFRHERSTAGSITDNTNKGQREILGMNK